MFPKLEYVYILLTGILPCIQALSRPPTMVLENNQYKNMVIAIHESVAEDNKLLDTLKTTMTEASKVLLNATHNRAYFKDITILLPSTWSNDPSYKTVTSETVKMADVIITGTVRPKRSLPQTRSYSGCGKQGVHILLPVDFLTSPRTEPYYMAPARYFVHAFAQFRWGVFQEYPEAGESLFYLSLVSGHPEAVRCTLGIRGLIQKNDTKHTICYTAIDKNTGLYTPDCLWLPYPTRQRVKASIMDHQWITATETFCNDDAGNYMTLHNYEAPSKHNRLCSHRSTWDVISNTDDFSSGKNPPIGSTPLSAIVPNFKIVRANARRRRAVVVVDDKLHDSKVDAEQMINRIQHETDLHGIEVTTMLASQHANSAPNMQPQAPLDGEMNSVDDHIIFVKHNCENVSVSPESVSVIAAKEGIHGDLGPPDNHVVAGVSAGHTLYDRLRHTILNDHILDNKYMTIQREDVHLSAGDHFTDAVHLDPTVGQKTLFIFHYEVDAPDIILRSPTDETYSTESPRCSIDRKAKLVKFFFDNAKTGEWTYVIKSKDAEKQCISIIVSTTPTEIKHDPIIVRTLVDTTEASQMALHVDVTQGSGPVIGLNVTAKIETPSGRTESLRLYDNGAGADNTKNDGVYSRYYTKPETEDAYHITAYVTGRDGQVYTTEESYVVSDNLIIDDDDVPLQRVLTKRSVDGNIQRHVSLGSVHVSPPSVGTQDRDISPPSRVVDLKVARHLHYRNTLVLTWTAPGNDLDHGKVYKYEVFVGEDIRDVRALLRFDESKEYNGPGQIVVEEREPVAMAMQTETLLWTIPPFVSRFAFSVRGVDEAGNKAELSNVVTFGFVGNP